MLSRRFRDNRQCGLAPSRQGNPVRSAIFLIANAVDEPSAFQFIDHGDQPACRHADGVSKLPLGRAGISSQKAQHTDQRRREVDRLHPRREFRAGMGSHLGQQECSTIAVGIFFHADRLAW
jgi:hypothetical protein